MNQVDSPDEIDLTNLAVQVVMGLVDPFHYHSRVLTEEELASLKKPVRDPNNESVFDFQKRFRSWKNEVGTLVKHHLAKHLSEKLKKL